MRKHTVAVALIAARLLVFSYEGHECPRHLAKSTQYGKNRNK